MAKNDQCPQEVNKMKVANISRQQFAGILAPTSDHMPKRYLRLVNFTLTIFCSFLNFGPLFFPMLS
jgi:hypothetical protein